MNFTIPFFAGAFGLGGPELILIFAVLLLLFGGSKLPELAKGLGKSIKEFKHATRDEPTAPMRVEHESNPPASGVANTTPPAPVTSSK